MSPGRIKVYFIRVTNVGLFNALVSAAENAQGAFEAQRDGGYYVLATRDVALWRELYLYGQMLAQAQDEQIEGGEELTL